MKMIPALSQVGLQTQPNFLLIGEEILERRMSLSEIVSKIADVVEQRYQNGKNFGTIVVPDGLVSNILEFRLLIGELERLDFGSLASSVLECSKKPSKGQVLLGPGVCLSKGEEMSDGTTSSGTGRASGEVPSSSEVDSPENPESALIDAVAAALSPFSSMFFRILPHFILTELLEARKNGAAAVLAADVETERLLAEMVKAELHKRDFKGAFSPVCQFVGYQARCSMPSAFDSNYGFALGQVAARLILENVPGGYLATVSGLASSDISTKWRPAAVPLYVVRINTCSIPVWEEHGTRRAGKCAHVCESRGRGGGCQRERVGKENRHIAEFPSHVSGGQNLVILTTCTLRATSVPRYIGGGCVQAKRFTPQSGGVQRGSSGRVVLRLGVGQRAVRGARDVPQPGPGAVSRSDERCSNRKSEIGQLSGESHSVLRTGGQGGACVGHAKGTAAAGLRSEKTQDRERDDGHVVRDSGTGQLVWCRYGRKTGGIIMSWKWRYCCWGKDGVVLVMLGSYVVYTGVLAGVSLVF